MISKPVELNGYSSLLLQRAIEAGIASPRELANIMGNASVETAHFSTLHERFDYRSSDRIIAAVNSAARRFSRPQIDDAVVSRDPQRIATILYENRADLGNVEPGDGWRFHGRGFFQYTGRDNYARWGRQFGVDLVGHPEQAAEPEMAAKLAISYWKTKVPIQDRENVRAAAEIINGGPNGMEARITSAEQWRQVISRQLIADVLAGHPIYHARPPTVQAASSPGGNGFRPDQELVSETGGCRISAYQEALSGLGYRGINNRLLVVDGVAGANTATATRSFQSAHHLHVDGVVGKETLAALVDAKRWPLLSEATHPQHELYAQIREAIGRVPGHAHGSVDEFDNAAVALTIAAHVGGIDRVDHVVLGSNGVNLFAVQGRLEDPGHRRVHVDLAHAVAHVNPRHDMPAQRLAPANAPLHASHLAASQPQAAGAPAMAGP